LVNGAGVTVIAGNCSVLANAVYAGIIRTHIKIIAINRHAGANAVAAEIIGAWIAVAAIQRGEDAASIAGIGSAGISISAQERSVLALPANTNITGADISIITVNRNRETSVEAAIIRCAGIAIIADNGSVFTQAAKAFIIRTYV
jgi:hypothetical protein